MTEVHGKGRVSGVTVKNLDSGETENLKCDTLVTAVGLLPERELALPLMQDGTLPDWLGFAGNCERIHEIVDAVTVQALALGEAAIRG